MNFIKVENYDKLSAIAANIIASQVTLKPDCVLGLATGSSPLGTYAKLAEKYNAGELDFSKVTSVNLDEYVGLDGTNDQSNDALGVHKNFSFQISSRWEDTHRRAYPSDCIHYSTFSLICKLSLSTGWHTFFCAIKRTSPPDFYQNSRIGGRNQTI